MNTPSRSTTVLDALRARARSASGQAHTPFSGRPVGAALLLADGKWVPGVRVESASYPLTISALLGAYVTAVSGGRTDVRAAALTRDLYPGEIDWLSATLGVSVATKAPDGAAFGAAPLPDVGDRLEPFTGAVPTSDEEGIGLARLAAERAHVPESNFRVGCALVTSSGRVVPGCNVEFGEWPRGLCAERSALAAAAAYDAGTIDRIYLSCPTDPQGTPCGACRQLLAEQADGAPIVMDRGNGSVDITTGAALLPSFFTGDSLRQ